MPRAGPHAGLGQGVQVQPPRLKVAFRAAAPRTIPTGTSPSPCLQTPGTGLWSGCRCRTTTASLPPGPEDLAQEGAGPGLASEPQGSGSTTSMNGKRGPAGSGELTSFSVRSKQLSGCSTPHHGGTPCPSMPPHHRETEDTQRHGPPVGSAAPSRLPAAAQPQALGPLLLTGETGSVRRERGSGGRAHSQAALLQGSRGQRHEKWGSGVPPCLQSQQIAAGRGCASFATAHNFPQR